MPGRPHLNIAYLAATGEVQSQQPSVLSIFAQKFSSWRSVNSGIGLPDLGLVDITSS
jgi:hypothetical protein